LSVCPKRERTISFLYNKVIENKTYYKIKLRDIINLESVSKEDEITLNHNHIRLLHLINKSRIRFM